MKLAARIQRTLKKMFRRKAGNSVTVTLAYDRAAAPTDPNDAEAATSGGDVREDVRALVHWVSPGDVAQMGMLEAAAGDVIVDFAPETNLDHRNLRFLIGGQVYAQRRTGKDVSDWMETMVSDRRMFRTVLLSPQPDGDAPAAKGTDAAVILWRDADGEVRLWRQDFTTGVFTATAPTAGRAVIHAATDGTHVFFITFNGVKALGILPDGTLECETLLSGQGTGPASLPALEFYAGSTRLASLTADGTLSVARTEISGEDPAIPKSVTFRSGSGIWLATLAAGRLVAQATSDHIS